MIKTFVGAAALALTASAASAATLSYLGTGQTHTVTRNDVNAAFNTSIDFISGDQKTEQNGLWLSITDRPMAQITYTFLGSEAGNRNYSASMDGTDSFFVNRSTVGATYTTWQATDGLVDFAFGTSAPESSIGLFLNNALADPASVEYAIGYVRIDEDSFYVLFDDIAWGDRDFDDMVMRIDVASVPLPAGGLLLLSGLAGAAALRRRKKAA